MVIMTLLVLLLMPLAASAETADQWQARFQSHLSNAVPFDSPLDPATAMNQAKREASDYRPNPQPAQTMPFDPFSDTPSPIQFYDVHVGTRSAACTTMTLGAYTSVSCR